MIFYTDSHAHIYLSEFKTDRVDILNRCEAMGVRKIFMPNIDHTSIDDMLETEQKFHAVCYAMMGLHPCSVKKDFQKELYIIEEWLARRKFVALGEVGTDLYWDRSFWEQQKEAFRIQVNWAKHYQLPVVIHCRESIDETIALVEQLQDGKLTGVFHCFSGNKEQAEKIIKLGFLLGIGGVATFKKGGLDSVLPDIDLKHLVLETDSPYLAPVPHRGKRNDPSYIPIIAARVAELKNVALDEAASVTTANTLKLFGQELFSK